MLGIGSRLASVYYVWRKEFGHFLVVVQLIHRLTRSDISCTTTARLFFFPLFGGHSLQRHLGPEQVRALAPAVRPGDNPDGGGRPDQEVEAAHVEPHEGQTSFF